MNITDIVTEHITDTFYLEWDGERVTCPEGHLLGVIHDREFFNEMVEGYRRDMKGDDQ